MTNPRGTIYIWRLQLTAKLIYFQLHYKEKCGNLRVGPPAACQSVPAGEKGIIGGVLASLYKVS